MNNQPTAFFFQIQPIPDDTILFDQFEQQNIFYSYFQGEQNYYLFLYSQKFIDIDSIDPFIHIIQELDTKQRKIRSLRGFFLYALEIFERTNNSQILKTNLKPSFWRNLKSILRQNKKAVLLQFLFGRGYSYPPSSSYLEDQIQTLKNQVDSLQQKIIQLEHNQNILRETNLNVFSELPKSPKIDSLTLEQGDYTLEGKKGSYLTENHTGDNLYSNTLSEPSKMDFKASSNTQQYNSDKSKTQNQSNFSILSQIPEQEIIKIIQKGFQLNQEGKISLKNIMKVNKSIAYFNPKGIKLSTKPSDEQNFINN